MITWMQRHKRWLVITIWISTIAFVGAGFVGWGSYDYGKSSGSVAVVGDKEIKVTDLQSEYNALYSRYQNALGEAFNQEMAKKVKLQQAAYTSVIQKFTLLNYADELGLYITDKEIAKYLVTIPAFIKDGKFNKDIYLSVLKQNRTNPTDFEYQVKNDLLIDKLRMILNTNVTNSEINNLGKLNSLQDKVSINIISSDNFKIDTSSKRIKQYWSQNKENYKSPESYKIAITKIKIDENKKATKKEALKKYLKLKKDEVKFDETLTIDQNSIIFTSANLDKISKLAIGKISKPIEDNGNFVIVKLIEKYPSVALSFEKAFKFTAADYILDEKQVLLKKKIEELTANFKGDDIGFINQNTKSNIKGLSENEIQQLTNHVLNSPTAINFVMLDNKAVVYKITDSKISNDNINNEDQKNILLSIKNSEIMLNLLKQLENRYEVITNMKVN